jgi:octaprenyl-diphosphate synthase
MISAHQRPKNFPFELLGPQLSQIERRIRTQAKSFDPAVEAYVAYVCNTHGKRIRPALAVLSGGATGGWKDEHLTLGVVLELIHIATLVHDDIIDGAAIRRDMPTANSKWGNNLTVLLGDCLFAHALTLATGFNRIDISRNISLAANEVCQGEIIQTQRRFDFKLTIDEYLRIIEMKTAALFACAMELGAVLNGAPENVQQVLKDFGLKIGTAYQIYDDCVDLVGEEAVVGKTLGTDLEKGKLTLPILNLIAEASEPQRAKLNRMLLQNEPVDVSVLAGIADYQGAIEKALAVAANMIAEARDSLTILSPNAYSEGLEQITRFLDQLLDRCRT